MRSGRVVDLDGITHGAGKSPLTISGRLKQVIRAHADIESGERRQPGDSGLGPGQREANPQRTAPRRGGESKVSPQGLGELDRHVVGQGYAVLALQPGKLGIHSRVNHHGLKHDLIVFIPVDCGGVFKRYTPGTVLLVRPHFERGLYARVRGRFVAGTPRGQKSQQQKHGHLHLFNVVHGQFSSVIRLLIFKRSPSIRHACRQRA